MHGDDETTVNTTPAPPALAPIPEPSAQAATPASPTTADEPAASAITAEPTSQPTSEEPAPTDAAAVTSADNTAASSPSTTVADPEAQPPVRTTRGVPMALAGLAIVLVLTFCFFAFLAHQNTVTATTHRQATATALAQATKAAQAASQARATATAQAAATSRWAAHLVRVATAQARRTTTAQAQLTLAARSEATLNAGIQATSITRAAATAYAQALGDARNQANEQATATAQATLDAGLALQASHPVRVCAEAHYNHSTVLCNVSDSVIYAEDWNTSYLTYTTGTQTSFTSVNMHFSISELLDSGTQHTLGTTDARDSSLASTNESRDLSSIFASAYVRPSDDTSYAVEVDNGNTLLGTITFTYRDQPAPTPVPSGGLAQAIFPPDSFFVLPAASAGGEVTAKPLSTNQLGWPATPRSRTEYDIADSTLIYRVNIFNSADDAAIAFTWQFTHLPATHDDLSLTQQDSPQQHLYVVDNTLVDSLVIGNIELTASMPTKDQGDDVLTPVTDLAHALALLPPTYSIDTTSI